MEMETKNLAGVFKALATHVKETGWGVFDENVIRRIVEKDFPDSYIPTKDDLLEYFGVDYLKVNKLKPKCGIKRYNYFFKVQNLDSLKKKIDEKTRQEIIKDCRETWKEDHRVDKRIIENVYNFINSMPCSNTDYTRETGKLAPSDADLMKTLDMCLIDAEIVVEKISTSKIKRLESKKSTEEILAEINNAYKEFYKKDIQIIKKKETKKSIVEKAGEEEIITEIIPHKEFPEIFLNRLQRDIDEDRDYKITICILNMMKNERKTGILVTDVFCELKKLGFDCTGLNFGEWCNKNAHFRCVNSQVQLRPGSYCEMIINKRPILSKKEEIKPIVPEVKVEKKEVGELESFHILTERKLVETDYLKFEKKVQELNAYCCYVDFNNPESIQTSYELALTIGQDNVLGEKVIDKLCNTVLNAIKAYISNE